MPRKRNEPSVFVTALTSRWPVAAMLAAMAFAVFLIVPGVLASNRFVAALAPLARTVSLLAFCGFGAIALVKMVRESSADRTTEGLTNALAARRRSDERTMPRYPAALDDPVGPIRSEPFVRSSPSEWSLALLQSIEWKRFEEVVAAYFRAKNFRCETLAYGPDGGVDGRLYFGDLPAPVGVVQCKAWGNRQVGVAPIRELRGVMAHEKVDRGYFCATGDFSQEAITFTASNPIKLISGRDLINAIAQMPEQIQRELLVVSTSGDYTTPTCASCGIKLIERTIGGKAAWGCRNYPRCRTKIFRKRVDRAGSA